MSRTIEYSFGIVVKAEVVNKKKNKNIYSILKSREKSNVLVGVKRINFIRVIIRNNSFNVNGCNHRLYRNSAEQM